MINFNDGSVNSLAGTYPLLHDLQAMDFFNFIFDEAMLKLIDPVQIARRRVKGVSNTVVPQPSLSSQYNNFVVGVDLFDLLLSYYQRTKWWWPLRTNVLNAAVDAG